MAISRIVLAGALLVSAFHLLPAQVVKQVPVQEENVMKRDFFPVHGSTVVWKEDQKVRAYIAAHPEAVREASLRKTSAWNFVVGSTKQWWAPDANTGTRYQTASTCRAVGTHCYIFVEDAMWNTYLGQAAVDSVLAAFDLRTPANPSKGVYEMDVAAFGNPPDVDGDPRRDTKGLLFKKYLQRCSLPLFMPILVDRAVFWLDVAPVSSAIQIERPQRSVPFSVAPMPNA